MYDPSKIQSFRTFEIFTLQSVSTEFEEDIFAKLPQEPYFVDFLRDAPEVTGSLSLYWI